MRKLLTIWGRELSACFLSPVAYVTMVVFLFLSGWLFWHAVDVPDGANRALPMILWLSIICLVPILITVVTMRLFAEEKRSGTLESLMTAPVTESQVVLGKYAGALTFVVIVVIPAVSYVFILEFLSPGIGLADIDIGAVLGGGLIFLLFAAASTSIGLLISLFTRNQIVAAVCCFCGTMLPFLAGYFLSILPVSGVGFVDYISAETHILDFVRGSIDLRAVVFYVSVTVFFLFTSVRVLESRRWR